MRHKWEEFSFVLNFPLSHLHIKVVVPARFQLLVLSNRYICAHVAESPFFTTSLAVSHHSMTLAIIFFLRTFVAFQLSATSFEYLYRAMLSLSFINDFSFYFSIGSSFSMPWVFFDILSWLCDLICLTRPITFFPYLFRPSPFAAISGEYANTFYPHFFNLSSCGTPPHIRT